MSAKEALKKIQPLWFHTISGQLTQIQGVRDRFEENLAMFFDLLQRSLETGEPMWMDSILSEWVEARTETELGRIEDSLTPVLSQIFRITFELARENLTDAESVELVGSLLPVFMHAMEFSSTAESRLHVQYITGELEKARSVLERLEKNKSDFISVAAHELKTPLTLIEGYSSMLHDNLPSEVSRQEQAILYLKGISAGTKRLREIVDDMIDVSLIDNNMLSLTYQPLWINQLLSAVERELEETIHLRHLKYTVKSFPGNSEMIFGDGERLYQAFRNIIQNAIKYTPDGGSITINGRLLPGFMEIIVSDTGIGIDLEDHERIFEKFGRLGDVTLHSSGKTKFKGGGPGLGLPIAKGIIDAHGGTIWVESEGYDEVKCPGSKFHIMIPLYKAPPDDKTAKLFRNLIEK